MNPYDMHDLREMMKPERPSLTGRTTQTHGLRLRGGERALIARKVRALRSRGIRRPDVSEITHSMFA